MQLLINPEIRTVSIQHESEIQSLKLFDQDGYLIRSKFEDNALSFSNLCDGTYTVCMTDKENRFFKEIFTI